MPDSLRSIGIEYEVEDIDLDLPRELREHFNTTTDRSCEKDSHKLNNNLIVKNSWIFPNRNLVVGGEVVSKVLDGYDTVTLMNDLKRLTDYVISEGESPKSFRAGIHVHVCYMNPSLKNLKSMIRLWRYLEDVFYHIGGMGYEFRGVQNDSAYCRPLTGKGPIVVPTPRGYAPSLSMDDLLKSDTVNEFYERWGDLKNQGMSRYFPVRYHGFNLSPLITKGTIEFRVFNKTVNPLFLYAIINLCQKFSALSMQMDYEDLKRSGLLQEHSVYDRRSKEDMARTLIKFSGLVGFNPEVLQTLLDMLAATPLIILNDQRIYSHLRSVRMHWESGDYLPDTIDRDEIHKPNFVDLHVLRGE